MKKIIISAIMVVLVAGFVTAYPHRGYSGNQGSSGEQFTEIKELTGELVISTNSFPSIKVSGEDVTIITLGANTIESLKLENGSKITVRGYSMNTPNGTIFETTQLDYDNKTYEVHGGGYGYGCKSDRNGYDNGYGCKSGRNGYDDGYGRHSGRNGHDDGYSRHSGRR